MVSVMRVVWVVAVLAAGVVGVRGEVVPVPMVPWDKESESVKVTVEGKAVPVGVWSPAGVGYCHFDTDKPVTVTVAAGSRGDKELLMASTDRERFKAERVDPKTNVWRFTMKPDTKVYLKRQKTFICASLPEKDPPKPGDAGVLSLAERGVKPSATASATKGIQAALDEAAGLGKTVVYVPAGTYISGTLFMRDGVTLYLAPGAVLRGSEDEAEWKHTPGPQYLGYSAFIFFGERTAGVGEAGGSFKGVKGAAIRGRGTIDGWGHHFRRDTVDGKRGNGPGYYEGDKTKRARLIMGLKAEDCVVEGVTLRNPTFWTTHIAGSKGFDFTDVKVYASFRINNDGLNYDGCTDSTIDNCAMITGDDSHCLKNEYMDGLGGPNERIRVANSIMTGFPKGVKFGWAFHQARDVTYDNIHMVWANFGMDAGIKPIRAAGPKIAEIVNVTIKDSVIDHGVSMKVGDKVEGCRIENVRIENSVLGMLKLTQVKGLTLRGVTVGGKVVRTVEDLPADAVKGCEGVRVE